MQAPTAGALLQAARDVAPLIAAQAEANEAAGRLTDETIRVITGAGLHDMWLPRCHGGAEAWPLEALELIETLCRADASSGWVVMAWEVAMASAAAYLPGETADALFGNGAAPIIAGQGGALGRAEVAPGGYRLSGNWRYGSGLLHAAYIHTGAIVHKDGKPRLIPGTDQPEARIFIVPVEQAELLGGWEVMGLRATGSVDYRITDVFVPDSFTHNQQARRPNRGGDTYRIGIPGMGAICHSGFALGVGRRVLDELAALATATSARSGMIPEPGGNDSFREQFATTEAKFRSARALVIEAQGAVQAAVQRGEEPSRRETTLTRLALNHVTTVVAEVCAFAYRFAGGNSLRGGAIQRCLRDIYAGTQHASTAPAILRECGRELLGLGEGLVWGGRGLVPPEVTRV